MWTNHIRSKFTTYKEWSNQKLTDVEAVEPCTHQQYIDFFYSVIEDIAEAYTIPDRKQLKKEIEELLFSISDNGL